MQKAKVNRNVFIRLSVALKILYSRDRVVDMTGNLFFPAPYPAPAPSLATVTSVTNDLETKELAAAGGGPAQTAARDAALEVWNTTMRSVADYVDSIALGNAVIITSGGFTPTDVERTPKPLPGKPANLQLEHSKEAGAVIFSCDKVADATAYVAVLSTAPDFPITATGATLIISTEGATPAPFAAPPPPSASAAMVAIDASKERKKLIRGLKSGTRMHARMYAFNATGRGVDSDVISIIVG